MKNKTVKQERELELAAVTVFSQSLDLIKSIGRLTNAIKKVWKHKDYKSKGEQI